MDDTFIITGEFAHSSPRKSIEDRVRETMMEVGLSISVTTVTTAVAFSLGCLSDIPAVRSLCLYAGTTIVVDFIYQITIFIAILVLEERRIEAKRYDICCCFKAKSETTNEHGCQVITGNNSPNEVRLTQGAAERFMVWYSDQLLRPWVKAFVLVSSLLFLAICGYNATQLTQEFTSQSSIQPIRMSPRLRKLIKNTLLGFFQLMFTFVTWTSQMRKSKIK